jgi:hypothetical protein
MRTLIRASQLHPDISGAVKAYADPLYPNYSYLSGVSGLKTVPIGNTLYFTLNNNNGNFVQSFAGLTGNVNITGTSGIYSYVSGGSTIVFGLTGATSVNRLNTLSGNLTLSGAGNVDVWPLNASTIAISGISITGQENIVSYFSGGAIRLSAQTVSQINNKSGSITLIGENGTSVRVTGQNIYIDSSGAKNAGVKSLNTISGSDILLSGTNDININTNTFLKTITFSYIGSGWGTNLSTQAGSYNWIGYQNFFASGNSATFINGDRNYLVGNKSVSTINCNDGYFANNKGCTYINLSGAYLFNQTGSTIINGVNMTGGDAFPHPYSFGIGNSVNNSYFGNINLKALISGGQVIKAMKVPRTKYSGIQVPTGAALVGHVDYFACKYAPVTDFLASFAGKDFEETIYGRKYFVIARGTNLQTVIKDQADLFGGSDDYGIFIESGNDANFYIMASGKSTESTIFHASLQYSQFTLDPSYD